ncbi:MAG: peptidase S53, partial [Saccharolobus sp.]
MIKKSLVILAMLLLSSIIPIVAMGEGQANQLYYIYTTSPQYSIVPGSQFVQPLNSSQSLYIAVLLNLTNFTSLQTY